MTEGFMRLQVKTEQPSRTNLSSLLLHFNTLVTVLVIVIGVFMFVRMDQRLQRTEDELRNMTEQYKALRDKVKDLDWANLPETEKQRAVLSVDDSNSPNLKGKLRHDQI